ncbi:MAG: hypothetical protein A2756_04695 [Candidatus Ryanbacteria bacterium RIFCSPHIGHO2_01_FULL_48_27]|uniref:Quinate/shikimate 5-dehydrogenase/glutamyl-tRNA reductase domain-containing protein n=1 Tax=Candidatus Ryanbacteria bacterium RIFCSPHIGHO2_01_FULL_48_27 TaxID=1802115 RepID=A0A1G2G364_9BACT|nr:MAG: hypothetical protein A2756_04695 [Candidatus Ryanbacteria bacterium RIFCSPHIGHO2_01_FULL_48_27]
MKFFTLILHAIRDLVLRHLPIQRRLNPPGFAFIVHPRDYADVSRKYPIFRYIPQWAGEFFLRHFWPIVLSEVKGVLSKKSGKPIQGWVITIPLTAKQMMEDRDLTVRFIHKSLILSAKLGAKLIGLGALTASFTGRGTALAKVLDTYDLGLTTGAGYTSYIVAETTLKLADEVAIKKDTAVVAIVGAAGSIGSTVTRFLIDRGFKQFILIDTYKRENALKKKSEEFTASHEELKFSVSHQIQDVRTADIIITATNAPEALINENDPKPGSIIIDDAQPTDIHPDVILRRKDVIVSAAGTVHAEGIQANFNFGLKTKYDIFSCLAEVIMLSSHENCTIRAVGEIDMEYTNYIVGLAKEMHFGVATFQNSYKIITKRDIERVRSYHA